MPQGNASRGKGKVTQGEEGQEHTLTHRLVYLKSVWVHEIWTIYNRSKFFRIIQCNRPNPCLKWSCHHLSVEIARGMRRRNQLLTRKLIGWLSTRRRLKQVKNLFRSPEFLLKNEKSGSDEKTFPNKKKIEYHVVTPKFQRDTNCFCGEGSERWGWDGRTKCKCLATSSRRIEIAN